MKRAVALILAVALVLPGCASHTGAAGNVMLAPPQPEWVKDYAAAIPLGSPVRVSRFDESTIRGDLIAVTNTTIVLQKRTRLPEAPVSVPMQRIRSVEVERPSGNLAKAIAIGAAAGAGAALGLLMIFAAIYSD